MASTSQRQKARHGVPLSLDADIKALDRAKGACSIPHAQIAFDSASALLTTIRVRSHLFRGYELQAHVDSGFHSPKAGLLKTREILRWSMQTLDRGLEVRQSDELSPSVLEATDELIT